MNLILIQSSQPVISFVLGETELDGISFLRDHPQFSEALYPFFENELLSYEFDEDSKVGMFSCNASFVSITINTIYDSFYFKIPHHVGFKNDDYYRYFSVLYTCFYAHKLHDIPEYTFSDWIFEDMKEAYFSMPNELIYPRATIVLLSHKDVFRECYECELIQCLG
jgi:hypothetical protein